MILNILYELTRNIQCGYHNPVGKIEGMHFC